MKKVVYRSSIPKTARERVVERYPSGAKKQAAYWLNRRRVGTRYFHKTGELEFECPLRDGKIHGRVYRWDTPGMLTSVETYVNGLAHGEAKQWLCDGTVVKGYRMNRGTGLDLWWQDCDGQLYLAEVLYLIQGKPHGYQWWFSAGRLVWERHWVDGILHGVERDWNLQGGLGRTSPKYFVNDERVTKRQYLKACERDASLPKFRNDDNKPIRKFPAEVLRAMRTK